MFHQINKTVFAISNRKTKTSELLLIHHLLLSSFRSIENQHDVYRGKDCMSRFCEFLREHAMKIIN